VAVIRARRTSKIAAVALANKKARMIWAIMTGGEAYRERQLQAA
jgi:transposase